MLFQSGLGYSALNTARSALSSVLTLPNGVTVGDHPRIKRFMRGVSNERTSLPRYSHTWDVSVVLEHLRSIQAKNASLRDLTLIEAYHIVGYFIGATCPNTQGPKGEQYRCAGRMSIRIDD
jgi:hypothetical protein